MYVSSDFVRIEPTEDVGFARATRLSRDRQGLDLLPGSRKARPRGGRHVLPPVHLHVGPQPHPRGACEAQIPREK